MKKIFFEVGGFDSKCCEKYFLSEDILQENAAIRMAKIITKKFVKNSTILIVCGNGNNGADGMALARILNKKYQVFLYLASEPKSIMAKLQLQRSKAINIKIVDELKKCDVVIDCLFGSGLNKTLDKKYVDLIAKLNLLDAYKISCDIPSGLSKDGIILGECFKASTTVTMGALKMGLFSDSAKDFVGEIKIGNLGVHKSLYEEDTNCYLLQKKDMKLPFRKAKNTHKGNYGHLAVVIGEKIGAGILSCKASFSFGSALVSAICKNEIALPHHIMSSKKIPQNITSIALGMGLGEYKRNEIEKILSLNIPKVIDADLFYDRLVLKFLEQDCVLTPHPKEFVSLLKFTGFGEMSVEELQQNRFKYAKDFSLKYPSIVLYLKGANSIIAQCGILYINDYGSSELSKGGSGDVLTGLIGALLAQKYTLLDATITASLAHTLSIRKCKKNSYALKPQDIIKGVEKLNI